MIPFKEEIDKKDLNGYYIETRYPAEDPLIAETEDVKEGLKFTEEIINFIERNI